MSNGDSLINAEHIVDALIVAGIASLALLLGANLLAIVTSDSYVSIQDVQTRFLTAVLAFGLTFLAQWARYRGIQIWNLIN